MPLLPDDFVPALGLDDGHAQTVFAAVARRAPKLSLERLRLETPDHDFIDVDVLAGHAGAPTIVVVHGLEASSEAPYVREVLAGCQARGWAAWALNLRSCSGSPNRQAASYCSGDYRDLSWLLEKVIPGPVYAIGFSLGASVVLNLVAQRPPPGLRGAVAISTPFDLAAGARFLDSDEPFARVYVSRFLLSMKQKALTKAARFPRVLDAEAIRRTQRIRDFDHVVTAPLFGYSSAEDYYARCSTAPQLANIRIPTLLISAEDDAMAPPRLTTKALASPHLDVLVTRRGGHVAFVAGSVLRPRYWAEARALEWIAARYA